METPQLFNSDSLLQKAKQLGEKESSQEVADVVKRLKKPFESVESGDGIIDIDIEGQVLHVELVPNDIHFEDTELFGYHFDDIPEEHFSFFKRIQSLKFRTNNTEIDLFSLLPPGYKILYYPSATDALDHDGAMSPERKVIGVVGDIRTPLTIIILLHEMGHAVDEARLEKFGVDTLVTSHEYKDHAEKLRMETAASAFAVSVMRRYMKDVLRRSDIVSFLKNYALRSHCLSVNGKIGTQESYKSHMNREWAGFEALEKQEEDDRMYLDAWEKWQKTEKYREWKQLPEHANLSEGEEFGVWREWVETIKYEFWNDFPAEEDKTVSS